MYTWFLACTLGVIAVTPIHFLSVEHLKLRERYGKKKGTRIGDILGLVSGWFFFLFWIGIWISPQPRFYIGGLQIFSVSFSLLHLILSVTFIVPGAWLSIRAVRETTLKVAETHRTEKIVKTGVYSFVRHPQYLGGLMSHIGISFLLSALFSLLATPLMIVLNFLISKKEEEELIREFGEKYKDYTKEVPMFLPKRIHKFIKPS